MDSRQDKQASDSPSQTRSAQSRDTRHRIHPGRVFYGWWLVPVSGFVMLTSSTPMFHAMGLWFVAMESAFGWSRTQLSLAFAFTRVEGGILGPVEGYMVDKFGTRRLVLIGMIIMGVGWLLFSRVEELWMFYAVYMVIALGQGIGGWLPLMAMLNNWFSRRRAMAVGWSSFTSRLGGLALIPALAWAIDPVHDRIGWSVTTMIIGGVVIVLAFPVTRLIRNKPEEYGLLPDGDKAVPRRATQGGQQEGSESRSQVDPDFTVRQALNTSSFWLISIGHGLTSMVLIGMMAHLAPMMRDQGYDLQTAAFVITAYTIVSMVFQVVGGFVGDRVPIRLALFVFIWIQASSVFLLALGPPTLPVAYGFAALFGIGFGGRSPLTISIRGQYFGRKSFGKIMGLSQVPMNVLLLAAPVFAGLMRDIQGDYVFAFTVLGVCNLLGGVMFLLARRPRIS